MKPEDRKTPAKTTAAEARDLARALRGGDRRALARAITLIESTRADHRRAADRLLRAILPHTGGSIRLAVSGVPGVGKSTFIEALGLHVIEGGRRVAVLAVDPSSPRAGGSILGDKTRMEALSRNARAFIRPSPAGGTPGGVARRTREALLACEAAGFDVVIVETVGVGQSEFAVADMVDMFLLLLAPVGGDDLQGIKKGIMELADVVIVNKADGVLSTAAERTRADFSAALGLMRPASPDWVPSVMTCSALTGAGIGEVWGLVKQFNDAMTGAGHLQSRRADQARAWMWNEVTETLMDRLRADGRARQVVTAMEEEVAAGKRSPTEAAQAILAAFLDG
ncbi:MAG: methylmalonyl Co-A mutase-associated GTPase MeaB [Rhodospirillales bacterium]|jgi:LAO/AO transport system kinase|nr:methylmalonyl Co-A mutase-associated GTPase MeaB [Rhodospirillales bacterium]MDP6883575.1 methylmalonyl Co-A mutase-associated GTPase MeaB [Rhodospirillales bacterium]